MLGIKRLYWFMLRTFLPLFVMTFFICLFIVLMQFLWRYIDDLVGKGLGVDVIAELFFYAALTMIPMALPLAVLLASLMTFGNLGEHFELTAMKASGISLIKVMRPLMVLMAGVAIAAFFFQNDVLPIAQTKMWTLLYSMRQKSPELEIPEGVFYDQIPGYNFFVGQKNRDDGTLYDIMIYDVSRGFDNSSIILADSGRLAMSEDKSHLLLNLWHGESFDNLRDVNAAMTNVPYRRETFTSKDILVKFDANFNRMDEDGMRNQYVGKNIAELKATIDSVGIRVDSIGRNNAHEVLTQPYMGLRYATPMMEGGNVVERRVPDVSMNKPVNVDSVLSGNSTAAQANYLKQAIAHAKQQRQQYEFRSLVLSDEHKTIRRHGIEMHKKFTLSIACIIFFFIGAPLGAIIRKGGIGTPLVISVILFIFYYIVDNTGYKMARDGKLDVWEGIWLSSAVLLPLGVFFTYKAVHDSAVFNPDAYRALWRRLIGVKATRHLSVKELTLVDVDAPTAQDKLGALEESIKSYIESNPVGINVKQYWLRGYDRAALSMIVEQIESTVEYLSNSPDRLIVAKLEEIPLVRDSILLHPVDYPSVAWAAMAVFPVGLTVYVMARHKSREIHSDLTSILKTLTQLQALVSKQMESKNN